MLVPTFREALASTTLPRCRLLQLDWRLGSDLGNLGYQSVGEDELPQRVIVSHSAFVWWCGLHDVVLKYISEVEVDVKNHSDVS